MFTTFDKAIAGGAAVWLSTGVLAIIASVLGHPLDPTLATMITTGITAGLVFLTKNVAPAK